MKCHTKWQTCDADDESARLLPWLPQQQAPVMEHTTVLWPTYRRRQSGGDCSLCCWRPCQLCVPNVVSSDEAHGRLLSSGQPEIEPGNQVGRQLAGQVGRMAAEKLGGLEEEAVCWLGNEQQAASGSR